MPILSVQLYNIKGQLVKEELPQGINQQFTLDNLAILPKGIYQLIVHTNEANYTGKLIR